MKKKAKRRKNHRITILAVLLFVMILVDIILIGHIFQKKESAVKTEDVVKTDALPVELPVEEMIDIGTAEDKTARPDAEEDMGAVEDEAALQLRQAQLKEAADLEACYDYDGAVALLESMEGAAEDAQIQALISQYQSTKDACVPVKLEEVTHIFYHTLVVDPKRCFAGQETNNQAKGNNQWMTTIDEFKKITQEMYDRGYVIVSIHDLFDVVTDESGNTVFQPATILLPEGKKAVVLSLDDLSYYHCYDNYGYASKLILDENGKPVNEYIDADGNLLIGAYDAVPLLDQFIAEHPDASYRGAKGIIALTGYNGILGYRTDISYTQPGSELCAGEKIKWLENHPDFNLEEERAGAKEVADAMKAEGWEFASHTWGHLRVGDISLERLQADTQRWRENVEPLVGPTDTIIFAHGQDLNSWGDYDESDAKYQYLREQGYSVFCNVDATEYMTWLGRDYLRQGRRNLDGYRIYKNAIGSQDNLSDLFDAAQVLDPQRPPVLPVE